MKYLQIAFLILIMAGIMAVPATSFSDPTPECTITDETGTQYPCP